MHIAGIDGCKGGWVVVHATYDSLTEAKVDFTADLGGFLVSSGISFAVIDIPIGFTSGSAGRDVESAMRARLKGKTSSVFNTPCRQALLEQTYNAASEINQRVLGKGMSKQTFAIFPKIRDVDEIVQALGQDKLREGHPEVTFAIMNGEPVLSRKKDRVGEAARKALLKQAGFVLEGLETPRRLLGAKMDDVLDAAALLWTARRFFHQEHITVPPVPSRDSVGLEMSVIA